MTRRSAPLALAALSCMAWPCASNAQEAETCFNRLQGVPSIAIRQAANRPDRLGFDFDLQWQRSQCGAAIGNDRWIKVSARGFQTFDRSVRDVNSMVGELALEGQVFRPRQLTRTQVDSLTAFRERLRRNETLTTAENLALARLVVDAAHDPFLLTYDLHYRLESDQGVDSIQHALGAGAATELPVVHTLLDLLPSLTRPPSDRPAQRVRVGLSLDYLTGADSTTIGLLSGTGKFWRVRLQAAWSTVVLDDLRFNLDWQIQGILNPSAGVKAADRQWNPFLHAWLAKGLSDKTQVVIEYVDGRLQPNYELVSSAMLGLRIALR